MNVPLKLGIPFLVLCALPLLGLINRGAWSATLPTQTQNEHDLALVVALNWPCLAVRRLPSHLYQRRKDSRKS